MTHQHAGYPHEPATPGPYPAQGGFPPPPTPPERPGSTKTVLIIAICVAVVAALGSAALLVFSFGNDDDAPQAGNESSQDTNEPADDTDTDDLTPIPVNYTSPEGFTPTSTAELITPLFPTYDVEFLSMDDVDTYESVFVVSYVLDSDTTDYTDDQLVDEVASYADALGKLNSDQPSPVDIGDKTWIFDYIQQSGLNDDVISYEAYFFFEGPYMIEVGCQPEKETTAVIEACGSVLGTITW